MHVVDGHQNDEECDPVWMRSVMGPVIQIPGFQWGPSVHQQGH